MSRKKQKLKQARNLYFETDFTQSQIADLLCVSKQTVSAWAIQGRWHRLKQVIEEMPAAITESMFSEIAEMNNTIRSRAPGMRCATREEAAIRHKTLASAKYIQDRMNAGAHIEVLMNFIKFMKPFCEHEDWKDLSACAERYIKEEVRLEKGRAEKPKYAFNTLPPSPEVEDPQTQSPEVQQRWDNLVSEFRQANDRPAVTDEKTNDSEPQAST